MSGVFRWLQCRVFGHNWSAWLEVHRVDLTTSEASVTTWTSSSPFGWTRMCSNYHLELRNFDWEDAPNGVITEPEASDSPEKP